MSDQEGQTVSNNMLQLQGSMANQSIDSKFAQNPQNYEYASELTNSVVISGVHDFDRIHNLKFAISELKSHYFNPNTGLCIQASFKETLDRRFLLIEQEIEGMLRRRLQFSIHDAHDGPRNLDFTKLLNEKENQIIELQKKINNFEEKLNRATVRQIELENKIVALKTENFTLRDPSYRGEKLEEAMRRQARYEQCQKDLQVYKENFKAAASIWQNQLNKLAQRYPKDRFLLDRTITSILQSAQVHSVVARGFVTIEVHSKNTVEVPVQDNRTKMLIHQLAITMKRLSQKYPKILCEINQNLVEFFQQEIIDVIEVDELDRLVEIVKYVPHTVRVENTYTYSNSKSMRVEFHLRVLLKALLEQLESLKSQYCAVLTLDEGVIGMIRQEILEIVNVEDILKVFRVVPKIVEVEKIVEKIVERIVEVPQIITLTQKVEKIVEVIKHVEVEKIIHVPVEIIKVVDNIVEKLVEVCTTVEKIVEVPVYRDKIVEKHVEVPTIVQVEKIVERVVIDTQIIEVPVPVNHYITEYKEVPVIRQVPVTVPCMEEKILEVPCFVEKFVESIHKIEVIRPVEIIKEVLVRDVEYRVAESNIVAINEVIKEVIVYRDKIVYVEIIVEKPIEIIRQVEKLVEVKKTETIIKEIEVIREICMPPIIQIREVEKIVNVVVEKIVEVEKIVDRKVEVPIIQERLVPVPQEITKIVIERIFVPQIIPTTLYRDKIIEVEKYNEITKNQIIFVKELKIIPEIHERIVEVYRTTERIKQIKTRHDVIIQKMVEVPKVVEIQIQIPKLVIVPRVIQKIVQVPVIKQVLVEKVRIENVPTIVQKLVTKIEIQTQIKTVPIEVIKYIQLPPKIIERLVEVPVPYEKIVELKQIIDRPVEKIVTLFNEVPKELIVEKIVPRAMDKYRLIEIEKPTVLVVEVPIPVDRIVEKAVPITNIEEKIVEKCKQTKVPVPTKHEVIKDVPEQIVHHDVIISIKVPEIHTEKIVVVNQKHIEQIIYQDRIVEQRTQICNPYPVDRTKQTIKDRRVEVPKAVPINVCNDVIVEKTKVVEVPKVIHSIEHTNDIIEQIREKIVPIYYKEDKIVSHEVQIQIAKQVRTFKKEVFPVDINHCFSVPVKDIEIYKDIHNFIDEKPLEIHTHSTKQVPVYTNCEKIKEVPTIMEKIVQRIVVMPQIVEVMKHVHEICETEELGMAIGIDIQVQEKMFLEHYGIAHQQLTIVLAELKKLRQRQPALYQQITLLEQYLIKFDQFASIHRIVAVDRDRVVEKEKVCPVLVPTKDSITLRSELAYSILIEKLVLEIKRIKKVNPSINIELKQDIGLIFFTEFYDQGIFPDGDDFINNLKKYTANAINKLRSACGKWTQEHELVINTILEERFAMDNLVRKANMEIEKIRRESKRAGSVFEQQKIKYDETFRVLEATKKSLTRLSKQDRLTENKKLMNIIDTLQRYTSVDRCSVEIIIEMIERFNDEEDTDIINIHNDNDAAYLRNRILQVEHFVQELKSTHNAALFELNRQLFHLTEENSTLRTEYNNLRNENTRLIYEHNVNCDENMKLKAENNAVRDENIHLRNDIAAKDNENIALKNQNGAVLEENNKLVNDINTFRNDLMQLKSDLTAKRDESMNYKIEINVFRQENMKIKNTSATRLNEITRLQHEVATKDDEIIRLKHENMKSYNDIIRFKNEINAIYEENIQLKNSGYNSLNINPNYSDADPRLRNENAAIREQNMKIRKDNETIIKELEFNLMKNKDLIDRNLLIEGQLVEMKARCAKLEEQAKANAKMIKYLQESKTSLNTTAQTNTELTPIKSTSNQGSSVNTNVNNSASMLSSNKSDTVPYNPYSYKPNTGASIPGSVGPTYGAVGSVGSSYNQGNLSRSNSNYNYQANDLSKVSNSSSSKLGDEKSQSGGSNLPKGNDNQTGATVTQAGSTISGSSTNQGGNINQGADSVSQSGGKVVYRGNYTKYSTNNTPDNPK